MKFIFLGSQGSGKSTQAKLLAKKLNLPWIEMGQILRDKTKENDEDAQQIKNALDAGELVADQITIRTLHQRLERPDCVSGYVLDGYPRNYAQIEGCDPDIYKVFYIKVSDQEGIKRSITRGRTDDTLAVLTRRLQLYHKLTEPLLFYFRKKGILEEVDGERTVEEIEKDIENRLKNEIQKFQNSSG